MMPSPSHSGTNPHHTGCSSIDPHHCHTDPHSTNDTLVDTAELTGGASAIAAAARKNLRAAEAVSSTGDMLSGRVLNAVGLDTQGKPLQQQADGEK